MKKYSRPGLVLFLLAAAIFIVQAKEIKIHFKNSFSNNHIYIEPPGVRAAKNPKPPFLGEYKSNQENSSITAHPGWPKTFAYGAGIGWCGPVRMIVSDLDGDDNGEVVTTMQFWEKGLIFKENGAILNSFFMPQTTIEKLSLGDIDNNKKKEIVTFSLTDSVPLCLYVFNWLGNLEFKKSLSPDIAMFMPILADLNNDHEDEVIIKSGIIGQTTLKILDGNGNIISKFSTKIEENTVSLFAINPVIGNFDNDVDLEIAVPLWYADNDDNRKTYIEIFNLDGTPVPGWENVSVPDLIYNPVCGDLNGNGQDEIISIGWEGSLFILGNDGKLLLKKNFSEGQAFCSPAIGDINNDGKPEIVFNLFNNYLPTNLLAIDLQGAVILKKGISSHADFSPLVGDMDGDGIPDIVFGNYDYIYAFNWQGKDISGFPIPVNGKTGFMIFGPGPSICDIDHDGKIEITYTKDNAAAREFSLFVLDIDRPYNPATMEWPMHQHDAGHSGRYASRLVKLLDLDLQAERREIKAFSILRQYGLIHFLGGDAGMQVGQYRIMRCKGSEDFTLLRTVTPSELQNNQFQMQDKYLEKDITYTYRVEAYDASGQLTGISSGKTI